MGWLSLFLAFCFPTETEARVLGPTTDARRIRSFELNNNTSVDFFIIGSDAYSDMHSRTSSANFDLLSSQASSASLLIPRFLGIPAFLLMLAFLLSPAILGVMRILRQAGSGPHGSLCRFSVRRLYPLLWAMSLPIGVVYSGAVAVLRRRVLRERVLRRRVQRGVLHKFACVCIGAVYHGVVAVLRRRVQRKLVLRQRVQPGVVHKFTCVPFDSVIAFCRKIFHGFVGMPVIFLQRVTPLVISFACVFFRNLCLQMGQPLRYESSFAGSGIQ